MTTRINKTNRSKISIYIINRLNDKSQNRKDGKKNFLSIIDIWDVELKVQTKFGISEPASQKITSEIISSVLS